MSQPWACLKGNSILTMITHCWLFWFVYFLFSLAVSWWCKVIFSSVGPSVFRCVCLMRVVASSCSYRDRSNEGNVSPLARSGCIQRAWGFSHRMNARIHTRTRALVSRQDTSNIIIEMITGGRSSCPLVTSQSHQETSRLPVSVCVCGCYCFLDILADPLPICVELH